VQHALDAPEAQFAFDLPQEREARPAVVDNENAHR